MERITNPSKATRSNAHTLKKPQAIVASDPEVDLTTRCTFIWMFTSLYDYNFHLRRRQYSTQPASQRLANFVDVEGNYHGNYSNQEALQAIFCFLLLTWTWTSSTCSGAARKTLSPVHTLWSSIVCCTRGIHMYGAVWTLVQSPVNIRSIYGVCMNPLVFVFILRASCFVQVYTTYCLMQVLFYYSLVLVDNAHAEQILTAGCGGWFLARS